MASSASSPSVAAAGWFQWPGTRAVFACLNREGFEARSVGGAVRNTLLGLPVTEVDFATTAKPDDTIRLARKAGLNSAPTGITHGTVTLIANGTPFEVTSLRRDVDTDGRHATVAFGTDWTEDARRRDFTMNALYADALGAVHDPLGGLPDLLAGRVRFVGDPERRIREDYLRILRFFRFSASYARGAFDSQGIEAAIRERLGLLRLSRERVRAELFRILTAPRAGEALSLMADTGSLPLLLGGAARLPRFERLCGIEAALNLPGNPVLRLAALAIFVEEDAGRLTERLRLSSREAKELGALATRLPRLSPSLGKAALEAQLYRLGTEPYLGRLFLAWADSWAPPSDAGWRDAALLVIGWQRPVFPVTGRDLMALGLMPGPELGAVLKGLEERWIAGGFTESGESLLASVRLPEGEK